MPYDPKLRGAMGFAEPSYWSRVAPDHTTARRGAVDSVAIAEDHRDLKRTEEPPLLIVDRPINDDTDAVVRTAIEEAALEQLNRCDPQGLELRGQGLASNKTRLPSDCRPRRILIAT